MACVDCIGCQLHERPLKAASTSSHRLTGLGLAPLPRQTSPKSRQGLIFQMIFVAFLWRLYYGVTQICLLEPHYFTCPVSNLWVKVQNKICSKGCEIWISSEEVRFGLNVQNKLQMLNEL